MSIILELFLNLAIAVGFGQTPASTPSLYEIGSLWNDESNFKVNLSQWKGKRSVLSMFYVNCNRTCTMTLKKLKEFQNLLDQKGLTYEIILVTLDPQEDLPESLASYRKRHHLNYKNWHLLTGSKTDVTQFAKTFKFENWKMDEHIFHDFRILFVDENGRVVQTVEDWHKDLADVLSK